MQTTHPPQVTNSMVTGIGASGRIRAVIEMGEFAKNVFNYYDFRDQIYMLVTLIFWRVHDPFLPLPVGYAGGIKLINNLILRLGNFTNHFWIGYPISTL